MKYIKLFEDMNPIEIGEYVICKNIIFDNKMNNIINSTIGQITNVYFGEPCYQVKYLDLPTNFYLIHKFYNVNNNLFSDCLYVDVDLNEIEYHSKDKTELELIISAQEYNL